MPASQRGQAQRITGKGSTEGPRVSEQGQNMIKPLQ